VTTTIHKDGSMTVKTMVGGIRRINPSRAYRRSNRYTVLHAGGKFDNQEPIVVTRYREVCVGNIGSPALSEFVDVTVDRQGKNIPCDSSVVYRPNLPEVVDKKKGALSHNDIAQQLRLSTSWR
jgi:DNA gyrase/topoisomerase IV subunit B